MANLKEKLEAIDAGHQLAQVRLGPKPLEVDQLDAEDDTISMVQSDCMEAVQAGNWRRRDRSRL
jgi:hypothetical protein